MKAWFIFSLSHCFIGVRWNPSIKRLQFFPLPCVGLVVDLGGEPEDRVKSTVALAYTVNVFYFIGLIALVAAITSSLFP